MNVIQSFLVPSPRDVPYSAVFNTCWHLYFLGTALKLEPGTAFIKTEAWPQFCIHSWLPWHVVPSVTFYTKCFITASKFCNTETGVGVLAPPFFGRAGHWSGSDHALFLQFCSVNIIRYNLHCQQFRFLTNVFQFVFPHFHLSFFLDWFLCFVLTSSFPPLCFPCTFLSHWDCIQILEL